MFQIGDYVVYKRDVCKIKELKKVYDKFYYVLVPIDDESLTINVPKDQNNIQMSNIISKEESEKLMAGKRGKLFCLQLSFIGWAILAIFTLGIGYLWLAPYIQFATIAFYKFANSDNDSIEATVVDKNVTEE